MDNASLLTLQAAQTQTQTAQQARLSGAMKNGTTASAGGNAKLGLDFETMCLSQLLAPMFEGLPTDGPFGGGEGEEAMRSFYVGAMAGEMAKRGGVGISNMMQTQLLKMQEQGIA